MVGVLKLRKMKLEIDTEVLCSNGISADEYILLYSLYHKVETCQSFNMASVSNLEILGFIKVLPEDEIILRKSAIDLFQPDNEESMFLEFFNAFPLKVPSEGGGTRPLRAKDSMAKSVQVTRALYYNILKKNPNIHSKIIRILEAEKNMRRKSNTFAFMHNIDAWLRQQDWEKYEYLLDSEETSGERVRGI